MPLINSNYTPTLFFKNSHFNTIYRSLFIKNKPNYTRKRITTFDADFIDLDFSKVGAHTLILLTHGLEGSSESSYIVSCANHLNKKGFDTVCFNLRGCSGVDNKLVGSYHSGKTDDLDFVIKHLLEYYDYTNIILVGFSLGGNLTLKYLGEQAEKISPRIKGAITVSVPIDIESSEKEMETVKNRLYTKRFLKTMKKKVLKKSDTFINFNVDKHQLKKARKLKDLENLYTVPVFGFKTPEDYWQKASSKPYLSKINTPTLVINAKDDIFLGKKCYPYKIAADSNFLFLETPTYGGHVGFMNSFLSTKNNWLEHRIEKFISEKMYIHTF